jgi:hypothetical protein
MHFKDGEGSASVGKTDWSNDQHRLANRHRECRVYPLQHSQFVGNLTSNHAEKQYIPTARDGCRIKFEIKSSGVKCTGLELKLFRWSEEEC